MSIEPMTPNLFEVRFGSKDVPAFDVGLDGSGWAGPGRQRFDVPPGYDGIRFIGAGPERTNVRPKGPSWDSFNATVNVDPGVGVVVFEDMAVHVNPRPKGKAIHAGFGPYQDHFAVHLRGTDMVAEPAPDGRMGTWGLFTYQAEVVVDGGTWYLEWITEHGAYMHGANGVGARVEGLSIKGVGAEGFKIATRPSEVLFKPGVAHFKNVEVRNWHQPHSWRGGAGLTFQGTGLDVFVERCLLHGETAPRGRCLAVDDGGWDHYGVDGVPHSKERGANGRVLVRDVGMGGFGNDWWGVPLLRCGPLGVPDGTFTADSFRMVRCAALGYGTKVEIAPAERGGVKGDRVVVERCNTDRERGFAHATGVATQEDEAMLGWVGGWNPVSEGTDRSDGER